MLAGELTESERRLWEAFARGERVDLRTGELDRDDPASGASWGEARTIRSDVIRSLLLGGGAEPELAAGTVSAVRLTGARITGPLDLAHAHFSWPVYLEYCWFEKIPDLRWAVAGYIDLAHSYLPGVLADNVRIDGNLAISSCHINGAISLYSSSINGDLILRSSRLDNPSGRALNLAGATITGSVSMEGFAANGEMRLTAAQITGEFDMSKAQLSNPDGVAFEGSRLLVGGPVFCRERFTCHGEMRLRRANISGFLDIANAHLSNPGGHALFAPGISVGVNLTCREPNPADFEGSVVLDYAQIAGELDLTGVQFDETSGPLRCTYLVAERMRLPLAPINTLVDLSHARVEILEADPEYTPRGLRADELTYTVLEPRLPASARVAWLSHQGDYLPQPYEQLAAAYRRIGHDADARSVLLAKERRRHQNSPLWPRVWGFLQDVTIGYGYRPARAGLWLITLLIIGTVVFSLHPPAPINSNAAPAFNPFFYSLDLLLPVVTYGQQAAYAPRGLYQWLAYGLMTAGWILATTIIAGITRALSRN
jgi:hypothetical protein